MPKQTVIHNCSECRVCVMYMDYLDPGHYCQKQGVDTGAYPRITVPVLIEIDPNCPLDDVVKPYRKKFKQALTIMSSLVTHVLNPYIPVTKEMLKQANEMINYYIANGLD